MHKRRPDPLRTLLIALIAVTVSLGLRAQDAPTPPIHLVILHANDTHGDLDPVPVKGQLVAGMARMATIVNQVRAENPGGILLLHAGDILSRGDALTVHSGGDLNFRIMGAMGFDALTPGNGDFYFGLDNLRRLGRLARFPLLHANTTLAGTDTAPFVPMMTTTVQGVRVAIIGVGCLNKDHPTTRLLGYREPEDCVREWAARLRPQCDLLIALTHIGVSPDKHLAAKVPALDLIVGGHSHTQLDKPIRVSRPRDGGSVVIVQAAAGGLYLGRVDVYLQPSDTTRLTVDRIEGRLISLDETVPEDPVVVAMLEPERAVLAATVATLDEPLPNAGAGRGTMGAFAAEAVREQTGADVALLDRGAVCAGLPAGKVTLTDICKVHPWRNHVLLLTCTGAQLADWIAVLDPLVAGCEYRRVILGIKGLRIGDDPAVADRVYRVAVGDYLRATTPLLRDVPADDTGVRVDSALEAHLRGLTKLKP